MFSSSQMFAVESSKDVDVVGQSQAMETPKPRQDEKQTCVPVTLRTIEAAVAAMAGGGELQFFGTEVAFVVVVGVVESVEHKAMGVEFKLNDATGRTLVRSFSAEDELVRKLSPGQYVEVVGAVRTAPMLHLSGQWIRVVTSADEVSYHMIAAAHAALKLQSGPAKTPTTPLKKRAVIESGSTATNAQDVTMAVTSPPKEADLSAAAPVAAVLGASKAHVATGSLRDNLMAALRQVDGQAGMHVAQLITSCSTFAEAEVRKTVQQLVEEGEAYNTLDDDHFALL